MNTKTFLTTHVPNFYQIWKKYKKGLGFKPKNWVISSDYSLTALDKPYHTITFTIFPREKIPQIINEIKTYLPTDIKKISHVNPKSLDYIKNSKLYFSLCIRVYDIEKLCNNDLNNSVNEALEYYKKLPIQAQKYLKDNYVVLQKFNQYIHKKNYDRKLVSSILVISKFISFLLEFLLIKESGNNPLWCQDRGPAAEFCQKIIYFFVNAKLAKLMNERNNSYLIHLPLVKPEYQKSYDAVIRVPDIITGVFAAIKQNNNHFSSDDPKFISFFDALVQNGNIILFDDYYDQNNKEDVNMTEFQVKINSTEQ